MKKFLLSLMLMGAVLLGNSQRNLWFNEIYPAPSQSNTEFIEIFNTSTEAIPLDCYMIVSYFKIGNQTSAYVYNFPTSSTIAPFSHYVIGSSTTINHKNGTYTGDNVTSWNGMSTSSGGYVYKYDLNNGQWSTNGIPVGDNFRDFIYITNGNDASINLLLYKIEGGTTTLINSVFGNGNGSIPTAVTSLPALAVPVSSVDGTNFCGAATSTTKVNLNFAGITFNNADVFNITQNTGNDNGYGRFGDGTCGNWDKFTGTPNDRFTPGTQNPIGTVVSSFTTEESIVCGNDIWFRITSGTTNLFPVTVEFYIDGGSVANKLDAADTKIPELTKVVEYAQLNSWLSVPITTSNILMVYKTAQGCYSKILKPTAATGSYNTNQTITCNQLLKFSLLSGSGAAATFPTYSFPVNVQIYYETDGVTGRTGGDVAHFEVPLPMNVNQEYTETIAIENRNKGVYIVYTSVSGCFTKTVQPTNVPPTITVGGGINCTLNSNNKRVATYFIVNASTDAISYPLVLKAYEDVGTVKGIWDAGDVMIGEHAFETAPAPDAVNTNFTHELINSNTSIVLTVNSTTAGCGAKEDVITNVCSILPVTYASFNATRNSNSQVTLEWETAMEENNRGFHVQRNIDGTWKNIGFVFTQATGGNSTSSLKYSFKDANSNKGISQYRILQVDIDGKGKYSEVRSVRGEAMATRITVFPNPSSTGSFSILFEEGTSLRDVVVSDVSGRAVKQYKGVSNSSLTIDNLGAGFYTVQILNRTTGKVATEKVIIKKR